MENKFKLSKNVIIILTVILTLFLILILAYIKVNNNNNNNNGVCSDDTCTSPISGNAIKNTQNTITKINEPIQNTLNTQNNIENNHIIAEYNRQKLSYEEFNKIMDLILFIQGLPIEYKSLISKEQLLNQTIIHNLIYEDAMKNGYSKDKEKTEKLFKESLAKSGMDLSDFITELENVSFDYDYFIDFNAKQIAIGEFINDSIYSKIAIDDDSALRYYNENKEQFYQEKEIRISHILVNTSDEAYKIINNLNNGENFAELAQEKSIGPSAPNGGDLDFIKRGTMIPEFENAAFALKQIGDYTKDPVKTQFGYHIIILTDIKDTKNLTFEEAKNKIKQNLQKQKQDEVLKNYINRLLKKAEIKTYLEKSNPIPVKGVTETNSNNKKSDTEYNDSSSIII